jgi:ABC-type glycerol-3-phosphate transport system substrate-binding protein
VLDAPWSSDAQKQAAGAFLDFLMSERVQKQSLTHGFRPGNPSVSIKSPDSPFVQYSGSGLRVDLTTSCEPPDAAVISNLLVGWQRSTGR